MSAAGAGAGPDQEPAEEVDYGEAGDVGEGLDDDDLDAIQAQLNEAESAAEAIAQTAETASKTADELQKERAKAEEERKSRDDRSIFVSGIDWNWVGADVSEFFSTCGAVARATVLVDKFGQPKG
jgi:polyadenylate-binding protein 2